GSKPGPPTGMRLTVPPASCPAHSAKKSVVEPDAETPTFLPDRSFTSLSGESFFTTTAHPCGVSEPVPTIVAFTPRRLANAKPGGKKLMISASLAAIASIPAAPPGNPVNCTLTPTLSNNLSSWAAVTGNTGP